METREALKRKIDSSKDLYSLVRTMKALAATSIQQYEKAGTSLNEYEQTIALGFYYLLQNKAEHGVPQKESKIKTTAALVFGSDQGMCGRFNQQVVEYTLQSLGQTRYQSEKHFIITIGSRLVPFFYDGGEEVKEQFILPSSLAGLNSFIQELILHSDIWITKYHAERILLFYNHRTQGALSKPIVLQLLPIENTCSLYKSGTIPTLRTLPHYTASPEKLFSGLIRQHLFVSLFRAAANSLESENASRLAAMQYAEKNIEERLERLGTEFNRIRQEAITSEILDIVSGYETQRVN